MKDNTIDQFLDTAQEIKLTQPPEKFQHLLKGIAYCFKYYPNNTKIEASIQEFLTPETISYIYGDKRNDFYKFVRDDLFLDSDLAIYIRSYIGLILLREGLRENMVFEDSLPKEELQTIMRNFYLEFLNNEKESLVKEARAYNMIQHNWKHIELPSRKVVLDFIVCEAFRKYLEKHYDVYMRRLIRPYILPVDAWWEYTFDPLIPQVFGSYSEFKGFLFNLTPTPCIEYNKKKFEEFERNGYEPIVIYDFEKESPCRQTEGELLIGE